MVNEAFTGTKLTEILAKTILDDLLYHEQHAANKNELDAFVNYIESGRARFGQQLAHLKNAEYNFTVSLKEIEGEYSSEEYGTISVLYSEEDELLKVINGNLQALATPYKHENTLRVELVPGSGKVVQFAIENQKVVALKYDGIEFLKL